MTTSTAQVSPELSDGTHGERWGGFIFRDPSGPPLNYTRTPPASGPVPGEEGIPEGHPGFREFSTLDEAEQLFGAGMGLFEVEFVPAGYEFIGGYGIVLESGRLVDFSLSYRREGSALGVLSPALWVAWSDRPPRPLPALITENRLPTGSVGAPVRKLTVQGEPGVYKEWWNPEGFPPESTVRSGLNWFEDGRLWAVQATEPLEVLFAIAESITPHQ